MHKRTDFIDVVKQNTSDPQCSQLLIVLYEYYRINDMETGGFRGVLFKALYLDDCKSYDKISEQIYIDLSTVHRHRIKFNQLALLLATDDLKERFCIAQTAR